MYRNGTLGFSMRTIARAVGQVQPKSPALLRLTARAPLAPIAASFGRVTKVALPEPAVPKLGIPLQSPTYQPITPTAFSESLPPPPQAPQAAGGSALMPAVSYTPGPETDGAAAAAGETVTTSTSKQPTLILALVALGLVFGLGALKRARRQTS